MSETKLQGFAALVKRAFVLLHKLEFGHSSRYGDNCPVCFGLQYDGVDSEAGPDQGHEYDCELKAVLDQIQAWEEE
jgi:hypothetical protein